MSKTYKGIFKPKNPNKYKGNPTNIVYRSGWELQFMLYLDKHPDILSWSSEEVVIPYISPKDSKIHRYFVDFLVVKLVDNKKKTLLIEVKPMSQTMPPKKQKNVTRRYINEVMTWGVNEAKWKAATAYAKDRGWEFAIFTEKELGIK